MSVYIRIQNLLARYTDSDEGASLVEYALLVSLIALVAFIAVATFGTSLSDKYSEIDYKFP